MSLTVALPCSPRATKIFETLESNVRGYCRSYPTVFTRARNAILVAEDGKEYVDFLAGAGTLSYGHNNTYFKHALLDYVIEDGIVHSLDMFTHAKRRFLERMNDIVLQPRELNYKIQFTGPTGTNAVEAALKIARNVTGRPNIVSFTNGFHGVTLGAIAATGNTYYRAAAGVALPQTTFMPYDGYLGEHIDTLAYFERLILDSGSGLDLPAAVIVETIQGEGGVNEASYGWLRRLERLCNQHKILLIIDDIQAGCGRTGTFFSFEEAGITPDIVTLSKSLSGYGMPMSVVLMKPALDIWKPGQHNGTFRGNNLAFVTSAKMLEQYWGDSAFSEEVRRKSWRAGKRLHRIRETYPCIAGVRGRGLMFGLECSTGAIAGAIQAQAFRRGLIVETCGARDHVIKFLPPLTIETDTLERGFDLFEKSVSAAIGAMHSATEESGEVL